MAAIELEHAEGWNSPVLGKGHTRQILEELQEWRQRVNYQLQENPEERPVLWTADAAYQLIAPFIAELDHEEFWVLLVDVRGCVQRLVQLYVGSLDNTVARTAEIFRDAIIEQAAYIIIAHNHPSGDHTPSTLDIENADHVKQASDLLEIPLLDSIVVSRKGYTSIRVLIGEDKW
jgi:DNA repair protein RadC